MSSQLPGTAAAGFWRTAPTSLAILFALAAPWSIAAAQAAWITGGLLVLAGVLLHRLSVPRLPWTYMVILLLLALHALSIPLGLHPARSLRHFPDYSWVLLFPFAFWGLLAQATARHWALRALAVSGGLAGLYGVIQHFTGREWVKGILLPEFSGGGFFAMGTLSHHLTYAGVLLPIFFLAIGLSLDARRRIPWLVVTLCLGLGLAFSFARTAWVGAAAGILILGLLRGRRPFLLTAGALVTVVVAAVLIDPAIQRRLFSLLEIGDDPRLRLWHTSLRIIADYPWTGAGVASFGPLFPIYSVPGVYKSTVHPHNDLLAVLVVAGIPGGLAWLGIWGFFFRETRLKLSNGIMRLTEGERRRLWLPDALRAGVAALLVAGLGQCFATDEEVAQVWWFLVASALLIVRAQRDALESGTVSPTVPGRASQTGEDREYA